MFPIDKSDTDFLKKLLRSSIFECTTDFTLLRASKMGALVSKILFDSKTSPVPALCGLHVHLSIEILGLHIGEYVSEYLEFMSNFD